jgi:hypothetical protein
MTAYSANGKGPHTTTETELEPPPPGPPDVVPPPPPPAPPGWPLWLAWTGLTDGVAAVVFVAGRVLFPAGLGGQVATIIATSALVAGAQWAVVRRRVPSAAAQRWWSATAAAYTIAWLVGGFCFRTGAANVPVESFTRPESTRFFFPLVLAMTGALVGALVAALQWPALRRVHPRGRWRELALSAWLLAHLVAGAIGGAAAALTQVAGGTIALAGLVTGLLIGAITGLALVALLRAVPDA